MPYRWNLIYDRMFDRFVDNSKILITVGMKQSEIMTIYDVLKQEIQRIPKNIVIGNMNYSDRMDEFLKNTVRIINFLTVAFKFCERM